MDCERCHERPARYHLKQVVNGETVGEFNLCERCAAKQGQLPGWTPQSPEAPFSVQQFLAGLLGGTAEPETAEAVPGRDRGSCPRCGHTYLEFSRTGLLGCPECYAAFSARLQPLIHRIHGQTRHEGKVPARAAVGLRRRRELDGLRRELAEAVAQEEFERAAVLRDRIRKMDPAAGPAR